MDVGTKTFALEQVLIRLIGSGIFPEETYLAGGSGLYFYLNHRISVDLDFFTPRPFNPEAFTFRLRECFKDVDVELMGKDTLILFLSPEKVKFSLFYLPYELFAPLTVRQLKPGVLCPLASLDDIEAMKALAIAQRGSAKDFVDLYYLVQKTNHSFDDLAQRVQAKYQVGPEYNYHLKTAMVYFDDAESDVSAILLVDQAGGVRNISEKEWKGIKDFFVRFCL